MSAEKAPHYHTVTQTLLNGLTVALRSWTVTLPKEYSRCVGILVYPHQALFNIRLGFKTGMLTIQELTHPDDWLSDSSIPYKDRPKPIEFSTDLDLTIYYQPLAALGADQSLDLVFLLR